MSAFRTSSFLSRVLLVDALSGVATGLLLLAAADMLSALFGLPAALLRAAGAALLVIVLGLGWLLTRPEIPRAGVWAVIAVNAAWAAGSILVLVSGSVAPTLLGQVFVIGQAAFVAVLAELQFIGLRRPAAMVAH